MERKAWTASTLQTTPSYPISVQGLGLGELPNLNASQELQNVISNVLRDLDDGPGFCLLHLPATLSSEELTSIYWKISHLMGKPVPQNTAGTMLYDVKDFQGDVEKGSRYSTTNLELTFHTDNSFGDHLINYVGLLCLFPAQSGGKNQIISGYSVYQFLEKEFPELLSFLTQEFDFDRRGGILENQEKTIRKKIINVVKEEGEGEKKNSLEFRFLRKWIDSGHEISGNTLSQEQIEKLNLFEEILKKKEFSVEIELKRGDIFFINNIWTLHNRFEFIDFEEKEKKRHLIRIWIDQK